MFELRLDALARMLPVVEASTHKLKKPIIVTARHPAEGGLHQLAAGERRDLLLRFLPHAAYVDVELRSAKMLSQLLGQAKGAGVKRIISVHDFQATPTLRKLHAFAARASALSPDIFKIATRVDSKDALARLLEFFESVGDQMQVSAMGIGKLGLQSRLELARRGSVLNYVHLGSAAIEGQPSLAQMRRALRSYRAHL